MIDRAASVESGGWWLRERPAPYRPGGPQLRIAIRTRRMSPRTEQAYVFWVRRLVVFHGKRHPTEMGAAEVSAWLSHLAVEGRVAASTQNQALAAVLFLYRHVLGVDLPWLADLVRAGRPARLPWTISTLDEATKNV